MTTLKFCGAAGTVTGSCSLIDTGSKQILVDCGLFQGSRTTSQLNYGEFPFDPKSIDAVLLTHAHIDHSGLLPKLVRGGFDGPIHCTEPTADLLAFMLPDSAYIQESGAERQNRKNRRRGLDEIEPIYTIADAESTLELLKADDYEQWLEIAPEIRCRFFNAGHLLGSASIEVEIGADDPTRMLFSGDLGPDQKAFHPGPDAPKSYDYVVCESTYGDRDRDDYTLQARREALKKELSAGLSRGGNVVIPSFAVERSQELLHDIAVLLDDGDIPPATVYLDSPMARKATEVFIKYAREMEDIEVAAKDLFRHERFRLVQSVEESMAINDVRSGAIIISASGMCNAGRIKHHLRNNIHRSESTVLFVGYQSPGTLGSIIVGGAKKVRIHGSEYRVAADIRSIGNYSAHADQAELIRWVIDRGEIRGGLFLNHGDDDARAEFKRLLVDRGMDADRIHSPQFDDRYELVAHERVEHQSVPPRVPVEQLADDWHNEYARFQLDLGDQLRSIDDAQSRRTLLENLRQTLRSASR